MAGVDRADRPRLRPHHQRLRSGAVTPVADALEQLPVRHARRREEHVVTRDEIVGGENAAEVVAGVGGGAALVVVAGPEPAVKSAADAFQRAGGDDALGGAADAEQHVGAALRPGGRDRAGDVAVGDEADPGAGLAALLDDVFVAGAVEDHGSHVVDVFAERLRHRLEVVRDRRVQVDRLSRLGSHGDLLHVHARPGVEHRSPLREGDHGDGIGAAEGGERGPVDGVDGDVARWATGTDLLAVVEHRRLVLLALTDDDDTVHGDVVEHEPHGIHGGLIGRLLVAPTHPAPGGEGGRLGHAGQLHGEVAVGCLALLHCWDLLGAGGLASGLYPGPRLAHPGAAYHDPCPSHPSCYQRLVQQATGGTVDAVTTARDRWQAAFEHADHRDADFDTMSGLPVAPVYGPDDGEFPGEWPYTRGPRASMYRSKLWTMRMFAGFGTAPDTNRRFRELLAAGGDGLSTAFDLPTLMGRDSDDPLAVGEVGKCGVAVDTL